MKLVKVNIDGHTTTVNADHVIIISNYGACCFVWMTGRTEPYQFMHTYKELVNLLQNPSNLIKETL